MRQFGCSGNHQSKVCATLNSVDVNVGLYIFIIIQPRPSLHDIAILEQIFCAHLFCNSGPDNIFHLLNTHMLYSYVSVQD